MYNDLFEITKAEGIYRTLRLWAMLSPGLVNYNSQRAHRALSAKLSEDEIIRRKVAWLFRAQYLGEELDIS